LMSRTLSEIEKVFERSGSRYEIVDYPKRGKKSVDVLVVKGDERFVIRVVDNVSRMQKVEADELKRLAASFSCKPVVISSDNTDEDLPIDKGVPLVHPKTLERRLAGEKFFTIYSKGNIYVRINPKELHRKRLKKEMSLGEVADFLGVTRMSVYEYERGITNKVSIEVAQKLVKLFGEEILGDIFEVPELESVKTKGNNSYRYSISAELAEKGYNVYEYSYSPADVTAVKEGKRMVIVVSEVEEKIENARKIVSMFGGEFYVKQVE